MNDKQVQKAGNGSIQNQIEKLEVNIGYDKETMKILMELIETRIEKYTQEAESKAIERMTLANERIILRIGKLEGALEQFKDPAFQHIIRNAQVTASRTDSKDDYEMLAELLAQHIEHKDDRIITSTVSEAIKIIDQIDVYSLQVLTLMYLVYYIKLVRLNTDILLVDMNKYFEQILPEELPNNIEWVNHLEILNIVRYNSFGNIKEVKNILYEIYGDSLYLGIKKDSENYKKALELIYKNSIEENAFIDNPLLPGYVLLIKNLHDKTNLENFCIDLSKTEPIEKVEEIRNTLLQISALYETNPTFLYQVQNNFMVKFNSYPKLKAFNDWISSLNYHFDLTLLGKLIVNMNLKRYIPNCPIFYKK